MERGIIVKSSDIWLTGGGNGKSLQYFSHENTDNSMKGKNIGQRRIRPPKSEGTQCTTWEELRTITNTYQKNEAAGTEWK